MTNCKRLQPDKTCGKLRKTRTIESRCVIGPSNTLFASLCALFSTKTLQAGAVKGLIFQKETPYSSHLAGPVEQIIDSCQGKLSLVVCLEGGIRIPFTLRHILGCFCTLLSNRYKTENYNVDNNIIIIYNMYIYYNYGVYKNTACSDTHTHTYTMGANYE